MSRAWWAPRELDWGNDASFTGDQVTTDTLQVGYLSIGRNTNQPQSPPRVNTARIELLNTSGDYYPMNTGSPLYGNIKPDRRVRVDVDVGVAWPLWNGKTRDLDYDPRIRETVTLECDDTMGQLVGLRLSTRLYEGITTGEAIEVVLSEAGVGNYSSSIPLSGSTTLPYWWLSDTDAYQDGQREIPPPRQTPNALGK